MSQDSRTSTIAILFAGMLIGGFVMFLLFLSKVDLSEEKQISQEKNTASQQKPQQRDNISEDKQDKGKFDFYQMLPEIEVSIESEDKSANQSTKPLARTHNHTQPNNESLFYLQVGAFSEYQSANKHKANLLLNNFPTKVQKGKSSTGKILFKVYVGPYSEGEPLNTAVNQLKELGLDPYKLRL